MGDPGADRFSEAAEEGIDKSFLPVSSGLENRNRNTNSFLNISRAIALPMPIAIPVKQLNPSANQTLLSRT